MKKVLLIASFAFLALVTAKAQTGLQIDSVFHNSMSGRLGEQHKVCGNVKGSASFSDKHGTSEESVVRGNQLKDYNLDYFRSIRLQTSDQKIEKIIGWIMADSVAASSKDMQEEDGLLTYALLQFDGDKSRKRYVGYQLKRSPGGKPTVTVVYMTGKATVKDLQVIFKHR